MTHHPGFHPPGGMEVAALVLLLELVAICFVAWRQASPKTNNSEAEDSV